MLQPLGLIQSFPESMVSVHITLKDRRMNTRQTAITLLVQMQKCSKCSVYVGV